MPKLYKHQLEACQFIINQKGSGGLFMEVGLGKSLTTLEIYKYLHSKNNALKLLVIAPKSLIHAAWGNDIKKFTSFEYGEYRKKNDTENILIINYESLISKNVLPKVINSLSTGDWMMVCDESSRMKNPKAITTKTILKIGKLCRHRIVLSGIPAPNSLLELYAQMDLIKPGLLGKSFYQFRNVFFHLERGGEVAQGKMLSRQMAQQMFQRGWKYGITDEKKQELMARIAPYVFWAKKKDCLDLPDEIDQVRHVTMCTDQAKYYKQMKEQLLVEIEGEMIAAQLALTKLIKLRQITGGFIMDETGKVQSMNNAKIKELKELLEDISDEQVIIWGNFVYEIDTIVEMLGRDNCSVLYGKTKDKDKEIESFKSGKTKYLVANTQSASHGLTFVNCSTQIFYSMNYSFDQYAQARGRTHRIGQKNTCTYIHLVCPRTIDEAVMACVKNKSNLNELVNEIVKGMKK